MTDYTNETQNINFRNYMEMPSGMDFESFLTTLGDHGISVCSTVEEFLEGEEALYDMDQLGFHLVYYGTYMMAKVKGFEALRDKGITAIFEAADYSASLRLGDKAEVVIGKWCRNDGVLYIFHGDMIDTTMASVARYKRRRNKDDAATAKFCLRQMMDMQRTAA